MEHIEIVPVEPGLYQTLIDFIYDHFYSKNPLSIATDYGKVRDPPRDQSRIEMLKEGFSLVAVHRDSREMAGFALNYVTKPTKAVDRPLEVPQLNTIIKFFKKMEEGIDVFQQFEADVALDLHYLCVQNKYAGLGIGRALVDSTLQLAREKGFKLVRSCPSHPATNRIYEKTGFLTLREMKLCDYLDERQVCYFPYAKPEDSAGICVKLL